MNDPCPACGGGGPHTVHYYWGRPQRIVCAGCGKTVRTYIRGTELLLAGVVGAILIGWLLLAP